MGLTCVADPATGHDLGVLATMLRLSCDPGHSYSAAHARITAIGRCNYSIWHFDVRLPLIYSSTGRSSSCVVTGEAQAFEVGCVGNLVHDDWPVIRQEYMKSPIWWIKNDRIGRSRLFILVFAVLCLLGSVAVGWPTWSNALIIMLCSVVLFVGDYVFWRIDLRRSEKSQDRQV